VSTPTTPAKLDPAAPVLVTLDNALTRAAQGLSVAEKRLMMIAVSRLDPRTPARSPSAAPLVTKVTAAEYAKHARVAMSAAYEALQKAAADLHNRKITFYEDGSRGKSKRGRLRISMSWVGRCTYHDGEGWIELAWWHEVMPYLTGLREQFTTYQLRQAVALRSLYSWRLLELISQYQDTGWCQLPIEEFCHAMDATATQRNDFAKIRTKIIEPAVKELDAKDAWSIQWEPIKAGRKVTALRFTFVRDDQRRRDLGEPKPPRPRPAPAALEAPAPTPRPRHRPPTAAELSQFARPGESERDAIARWMAR
jgi:plasmid replication initiation protein